MSIKYPKRASLGWATEIRNKHFAIVLIQLVVIYMAINLVFSIVLYYFRSIDNAKNFFDYFYFSFVTSLSIGYGDFVPTNIEGKILIIIQTCITAMYFALMVSILSIKLFYPRDMLKFSDKIIYNPENNTFIMRVINTNRAALVNPDLRISVTEHNEGDNIAGMFNVPIDYNITYLGKYDFSYTFSNNCKLFNIMREANKALEFNKNSNYIQSRFRINISITGSYGFNQIAIYKKYFAKDIVVGKFFKPITYKNEFYAKSGGVKYNKINNFWNDFEDVVGLEK